MEILNDKTELDLCLNEKPVLVSFQCRPYNEHHEGHVAILKKAREMFPNNPIVVKVYDNMHLITGRLFNSIETLTTPWWPDDDLEEQSKAFHKEQGVADYFYYWDQAWAEQLGFGHNECLLGLASMQPIQALLKDDYKARIKSVWKDTADLIKDSEVCIYPDPLKAHHCRVNALTVKLGYPNYAYRFASSKDGWNMYARDYLWNEHSPYNFVLVDAVKDPNGIIVDFHNHGSTTKLPKNWQKRRGAMSFKPKFLKGKTYYTDNIALNNEKGCIIHKIE